MICIIDNYDSFTWNLVQTLGTIDASLDIQVFRNDEVSVEDLEKKQPDSLIISPGPCTPSEAGISVECVNRFSGRIPILGVCLGHQSIGQATGGEIVPAKKLMHGKTDRIHHCRSGIFAGIESPMVATRYHSLVIRQETLASEFKVIAWTDASESDGEIMGIAHQSEPIFGVQFHPESFLTEHGPQLLRNFVGL